MIDKLKQLVNDDSSFSLNPDEYASDILQDISESLPAAIFIYSIDEQGNDKVQYISDGCLSIWGYTPKEVSENAAPLWQAVLEEDMDTLEQSVQISGNYLSPWFCEWRIKPKGETGIKWLRGYGVPKKNGNHTVWTSIILDVSSEKLAEFKYKNSLKQTVLALSNSLDTRDPYTAGHSNRVADIAYRVGKELGMDEHQLEGLRLGATIHDIGKIGIPSELLTKPTELNDAEFSLIKLHPQYGFDLLQDIEFPWPIQDMVLQHHERLDGSGYPSGLTGEQIILEARIIAVADVIESMSKNRPYRFAPGIDKAKQVLRDGKGTMFDSNVTDALFSLLDSGRLVIHVD